jgi:hypothetical protein
MSGTKKTKAALISQLNANINTNGIQAITGAVLNTFFNDLIESIFFGTKQEARHVAVSTAGSVITFPESFPAAATYKLIVRCYDANGDSVDAQIDPDLQEITHFHILPAADGFIDYVAITLDV